MNDSGPVVFLCSHGGAKSVIAASYFKQMAAERGLSIEAAAAAAEEPYDAVPAPVAELLERRGFDVSSFKPRRVAAEELRRAPLVFSIGCEPASIDGLGVSIERWDDVPMASDDLPGAEEKIREHVERIVARIAEQAAPLGREPEPWPSFLRSMTHIALHSFGGPVAQIAVVHEEVVERRKWIDDRTFSRLLSFANVLPGPEALELVIHVGHLRRGIAGGIVGGLLFIAPGIVSLTFLAWLYVRYGSTAILETAQQAIRPVAVGLVIAAALRLSRKMIETAPAFAIAAASLIASHFLGTPFLLVLAVGALLGIALPRGRTLAMPRRTMIAASLILAALAIAATAPRRPLRAPSTSPALRADATLTRIASLNLKTALVTFGGAYTALPYIREQVVDRLGWISDGAMLDALALGETTPGPLISIGVFVSYLAGGLRGALVGALFLFLPSFVLVLALAPHVERILSVPENARALEGVVAATIGLILALTIDVAGGMIATGPALIAAGTFAAVTFFRVGPAVVVLVVTTGAIAISAML